MKRYEKILHDYIEENGGTSDRYFPKVVEHFADIMKLGAWQGWKERFVRTVREKGKSELSKLIDPPLVAQKMEFESWWNAEIADPTGDS